MALWAVDRGKQQPGQERKARADTGRRCLEMQLTGGLAGILPWTLRRTNKEVLASG